MMLEEQLIQRIAELEQRLRHLEAQAMYAVDVMYSGNLRPVRGTAAYTGYVYVPLTTALTHSDWDGDAKAVGTYTLTPAMFGYPAAAKAVAFHLQAKWAAVSDTSFCAARDPGDGYVFTVRAQVANVWSSNWGVVTCDSSGQFRLTIGGANAISTFVQLVGYFI